MATEDAAHPGFFVPLPLLHLAEKIRRCYEVKAHYHNLSRSQFLFELDVFDAALRHPLRVTRREDARVVLLPLLAVVSKHVGDCSQRDLPRGHVQRLRLMHNLVEATLRRDGTVALAASVVQPAAPSSPRQAAEATMPIYLVPCTCVMQRSLYGEPLFRLLANHSHRIVAMTHARRGPPNSVARAHVISPYHSPPPFSAAARVRSPRLCEPRVRAANGGRRLLVAFAGSPETTRQPVTCVRHHIFRLARDAPSEIAALPSARQALAGASKCAMSGTCVDGYHYSRRFESASPEGAKARMARLFASSQFCLVPEGDSPESSRLYDAVSALCVPLVLTSSEEGLLVPRSRFWRDATLVLRAADFMRMDAAALSAYLEGAVASKREAARRCAALRALRDDLSGARMLAHAVHVAANLSAAYGAHRVVADFETLLPPPPGPWLLRLARRGHAREAGAIADGIGDLVTVHPNLFNWSERIERVTIASADAGADTLEVPVDDLRSTGRGPALLASRAERRAWLARRGRSLETDPICRDDVDFLVQPQPQPAGGRRSYDASGH